MKLTNYTTPSYISSPDEKSKYRLFNSCILLTIVTLCVLDLNNYLFNFKAGLLSTASFTFIYLFIYLLFKKNYISLLVSTNIYITFGAFLVSICSYFSGGFKSPTLFWSGLIPLYAFWLIDRKYATRWFFISLLIPIIFLLFFNNVTKDQYNFYENDNKYAAVFIIILLIINIFLVGYDFETKKRRAIHEMNTANDELKKALAQLETTKKELETAEKHKDLFIAQMSHEMRTPMTAIFGVTHILKKEVSTHNEDIEVLIQSSKQLLYIIDDLLDVVKIRTGKFHYEKVPFDLHALFFSVNKANKLKAEQKNLFFDFKMNITIPKMISGDPYRLSQILNNILGNAIKFTNSGSVKWVADYYDEKNILRLTIQDTGIGMTDEEQNRVFDVFSQANENIHLQFGGTGMGLSITKQLVELFGGFISLQSSSNFGTKIDVELPFEKLPNYSFEGIAYKLSQDEKKIIAKHNILLAEDNQTNQRILKKILEAELPGIKIDIASDGDEVLEKVRTIGYDIILMDVQMPKKDGLETTKIIKFNEQTQQHKTKIIALTAYARKSESEKCIEAGMDDYVSKPFNNEDLIYKIYKQLCNSDQSFSA
ncbi:MAG: response regulator [Ginsengibacter sp.]